MSDMNFNIANQTFRQLLGNGFLYVVPFFQRDYSWTEEEWDDLWQDIMDIYNSKENNSHYMGYLVLQSSDNKEFKIIDGQQRMTTLSILILAAIKILDEISIQGIDSEENKKRIEQFRNTYIGYLDPVSLSTRSKIILNKNNDYFYQNYLVPLEKIPKRGLILSENLLGNTLDFFKEKIEKEISKDKGSLLGKFIDFISYKLFFTIIIVDNELNAFKVFETLNARGVKLSATDLLKNYLFSLVNDAKVHSIQMNKLESEWERIVGKLKSESFPKFLRAYWNSKNKLIRMTELFKTIRKKIKTKQDVFDLIKELNENVDIFIALKDPEDELWKNNHKQYLKELKMFRIKQLSSLLMSAYEKFSEEDFIKTLKICSVISFRYNVICGLHTREQETVYNKAAFKISKREITNFKDLLLLLQSVYIEDKLFIESFAEKELKITDARNKKVMRYILSRIEKHLNGGISYDFESSDYNIEHVLPLNPDESWIDYNEDFDSAFTYRLGNYTMLKKRENSDLSNKNFDKKKEIYKDSEFKLTKTIAEKNDEWNADRIASRQRWMAKQAVAIWTIN